MSGNTNGSSDVAAGMAHQEAYPLQGVGSGGDQQFILYFPLQSIAVTFILGASPHASQNWRSLTSTHAQKRYILDKPGVEIRLRHDEAGRWLDVSWGLSEVVTPIGIEFNNS